MSFYNLEQKMIWAYSGTVTRDTSTGDAFIEISPGLGNRMKLLYYRVSFADYSAAKEFTGSVLDKNDLTILRFETCTTADNNTIYGPPLKVSQPDDVTVVANSIGAPPELIISGSDKVHFEVKNIAATKTMTVTLRAEVLSHPPAANIVDGGSNNTLVENYNEII